MTRPLSAEEKVAAFKVATDYFARRLTEHGNCPMDDFTLEAMLRKAMGVRDMRYSPGKLHVSWKGSGLRIWATRSIHDFHDGPPLIAGARTLAMAREVYGIPHPGDAQLSLF